MAADEKLSLEITFENGQFLVKSKETEESFKGIQKAVKSTNDIMMSMGTALTKYVSLPLTILGGILLESSSNMEQLSVSFEVMLGSAKKAKVMMKDLADFAAKTPFEMTDLAKSTETMLGFGIASKDIMKNLQMLGDISGGNSEKLSGLTLTFSQITSAGKLTGDNLRELINRGFNPLLTISEMTGKSMTTLRTDMEKGAISSEMLNQAMQKATGEGGRYYKMMKKQSQSLVGTLSTLKDDAMKLGRELVSSFLPAIKNIVNALSGAVRWFQELSAGTKQSFANFVLFAAALGPVILVITKAIALFEIFKAIQIGLTATTLTGAAAQNASTTAITANTVAVRIATTAQKLWNLAMKASPFVLFISALATVGGLVYAFAKSQKSAGEIAVQTADDLKKAKEGLLEVSGDVQKGVDDIMKPFEKIGDTAEEQQRRMEFVKGKIAELTAEHARLEAIKTENIRKGGEERSRFANQEITNLQATLSQQISAYTNMNDKIAAALEAAQEKATAKQSADWEKIAQARRAFWETANNIRFSDEARTEERILADKKSKMDTLQSAYNKAYDRSLAAQTAFEEAKNRIEIESSIAMAQHRANINDQRLLAEVDAANKEVQTKEQVIRAKVGMESAAYKGLGMFAQAGASLMSSQNSVLFKLGQASSLANIGMNTADAIVKGYAQLGPFGGSAFAAFMGLVGGTQGAAVLSQKAPKPAMAVIPKVDATMPTAPKIAALATGAFDVPRDMPAIIHQGESVMPKPWAQEMREGNLSMGKPAININVQGSIIDKDGFMGAVGEAMQGIGNASGQNLLRASVY